MVSSFAEAQAEIERITHGVDETDFIDIQDFTVKEKRIRFKVDSDIFEAYGLLGLPLMQRLVRLGHDLGKIVADDQFDSVIEVFNGVLYPESAKRFAERIVATGDDALDVRRQLIPILYFLLEKYGARPTQQSAVSSTGSPSETVGITSMAGQ